MNWVFAADDENRLRAFLCFVLFVYVAAPVVTICRW